MQVALIAPKSMLKWTRLGDLHFIIPQTADVEFYAGEDKYKILDNGAYESDHPMDFEDLVKLADELHVDEVIVPDVLFDGLTTYQNARMFFESFYTSKLPFKTMIVPQAQNPGGWIVAYEAFTRAFQQADVIGVPKWLDGKFHCRAAVLLHLAERELLVSKPHHLLGVDNLPDLRLCRLIGEGYIRSCDTSKPFTFAYADKPLSLWSQHEIERVKFDASALPMWKETLLEHNILKLKEAAQGFVG